MGDRYANLELWLQPCAPCERMLVYDRNGTCLGRVKMVNREPCGQVRELLVAPATLFAEHSRTRRIDIGHCRVYGGAIHTSYASEQLEDELA